MLTARGEETDRIVGLEMGADDYVPKPFHPRELLARVKSILRRARSLPDNLQPERVRGFRFAGWVLDVATRTLTAPDGVLVDLSGTEFRLLRTFVDHPHRTLTREQLIELMLDRDAGPFDRAIDVQVSRLRQRLRDSAKEPGLIKTVRGHGYVLAAEVEALR
jgi:two-component system OmpR family response regulator